MGLAALKDFRLSVKTLRVYLPAIDFHTNFLKSQIELP